MTVRLNENPVRHSSGVIVTPAKAQNDSDEWGHVLHAVPLHLWGRRYKSTSFALSGFIYCFDDHLLSLFDHSFHGVKGQVLALYPFGP